MKTALAGLLLLSLLLVACGDSGGTGGTDATGTSKAVNAAAIADEIAANPAQMEAILAKHDMTREQYLALIDEISEDPALSDAYTAARKVPTSE